MASRSLLTTRELKNKVTGIDLMVPDYEECGGKSSAALYHVIVITRLFYYKTSRLKESDVVQFMIAKRYEEFEDLYQKLSARFPSVLFPKLPRKPLIMNMNVVQERKKVMDDVMHLVARYQKLCCSPMLLEFLGVRKPQKTQTIVVKDDIFEERKVEQTEAEPQAEGSSAVSKDITFGSQNINEEQGDLFVAVDLDSSAALEAEQADAFTSSEARKLELHASLFEDEVEKTEQKGDSLFFTPGSLKAELEQKADPVQIENTDDLLDVDEDIDELMALSKTSERKASIKATSSSRPSVKPKPQTRTSFESIPDDDDLSMLSSASTHKSHSSSNVEEDLFKEARKMSLRDKREKLAKSDTLEDIFEKSSGNKNIFSKNNNDDSLFVSDATPVASGDSVALEEDDIMKYITDNLNQDAAQLDL